LDLWKSQSEILDFIIGFRNRSQYRSNHASSLDPKQITNAIASADVVTIQSIKELVAKPRKE
jgi:hypothetical protein